MLVLSVFCLCYLLFIAVPKYRYLWACAGSFVLMSAGAVPFSTALREYVLWNVIALFLGTLIIAELFMQSRMPAVIAEWCIDKTKTARGAMLMVCALSSALSILVENVAVVLIAAPIAISLCDRIGSSPVKTVVFLSMFSNVQGTSTLIGDPPSMILAGYLKLSFNDFFFYQGLPSIFFIVQIGALAAGLYVYFQLRRDKTPISLLPIEKALSLVPTALLVTLILILSSASFIDPDFKWFAGSMALGIAGIGLVWYWMGPKWTTVPQLLRQLDWETALFLVGLFILVGSLEEAGWIESFSRFCVEAMTPSLLVNFFLIMFFSVVISAFIDNVPYILTMIPVVEQIAAVSGSPLPLLVFSLLIGTCLGGNITPIGASTNIVAMGILKRQGKEVGFLPYLRLSVPFTLAAVFSSSIVLWLIWS